MATPRGPTDEAPEPGPTSSSTLPARQPLPRRGPERLQLPVVMGRAEVLDAPRATPAYQTICTAVAPEAVLTVRT